MFEVLSKKRFPILFIALIITVGIFARFKGLAWHFTHSDDVGVAKTIFDTFYVNKNSLFVVSKYWSYAPFQFFFTPLFINFQQSYRELLFWGRFPSAFLGSLGLFLLPLFYFLFKRNVSKSFVALALVACSWQSIIYAKQMHNYALGVTGAIGLLCLLAHNFRQRDLKISLGVTNAFVCAFLVYCHYQLLFLLPPFYITIFLFFLFHSKMSPPKCFLILGGSAVVCVLLVFPVYSVFLKSYLSTINYVAGMTWNVGPGNTFVFDLARGGQGGDLFLYVAGYFFKNFLLIFQSNLAFIPTDHWFFVPFVFYFLGVMFCLGIWSLIRSLSPASRYLAIFFLGVALIWMFLIVMGKTTLSPTRHNMIFIPFFAIIGAEGISYLLDKINFSHASPWPQRIKAAIAFLVVIFFLCSYQVFLTQRKDPFVEEEILGLVNKYNVDTIITIDDSMNVAMMKGVREHFNNYYQLGFVEYEVICDYPTNYEVIMWISHRHDLNLEEWYRMRDEKVNRFLAARNFLWSRSGKPPMPMFTYELSDYEMVYSKRLTSDIQVDYSNLTDNGSNNLFLYVLKRKK